MATLWMDIDVTPSWWAKGSQTRVGLAVAAVLVQLSEEKELRMAEVRANVRELVFRVGCIYLTDEDMLRVLPTIVRMRDEIRGTLDNLPEETQP